MSAETAGEALPGAITKNSLPTDPLSGSNDPGLWQSFRKTAITRAIRMGSPFTCVTKEGPITCDDGWLAVDAEGYPYPIAMSIFQASYVALEAETI